MNDAAHPLSSASSSGEREPASDPGSPAGQRHRRKRPHGGSGLYVTDAEIARRWGLDIKTARKAIRSFEERPIRGPHGVLTFPRRDPDMGNKRSWKAVEAYRDAKDGITVAPRPGARREVPDGEEDFDAYRSAKNRGRNRAGVAPQG